MQNQVIGIRWVHILEFQDLAALLISLKEFEVLSINPSDSIFDIARYKAAWVMPSSDASDL